MQESLKKELITVRHTRGGENKRQYIRKTMSPSSRFLDNYFNSGMHQNSWRPNGKVVEKKKYNYGESGLSHNYKSSVLQKLDINEKKKSLLKPSFKNFLEFEYMEEGEYVVTIEHCSNCVDHLTHTQHINEIYQKFAKTLQKCILMRFPYIKVYLKPIETDIVNQGNKKSNIIDNMYKEVRIGALEVQLGFIKKGVKNNHVLYSKLHSGKWPSISNILQSIVNYVPKLNIEFKVYDREEGLYEANKDPIKDSKDDKVLSEQLIFTKYENIKVNLYLLSHPQIKELSEYINEELESLLNPKKRKILLNQIRNITNQSSQSLNSSSQGFNSMNLTNYNSTSVLYSQANYRSESLNNSTRFSNYYKLNSSRPFTGQSNFSNRMPSAGHLSTTRPLSTGSKILKNENIEDKEIINSLKGLLFSSRYTDKNGAFTISDLPYDSYLLEVEDSKNFLISGSIIKFPKIIEGTKTTAIQKFVGLRRQTQAYVEIYIYNNLLTDNAENEEFNYQNISGSHVSIRRCTEHTGENFFDDENRLEVKENKKIKGRHEIITTPGKYILEIRKAGFELTKKDIILECGENKINVELVKEKQSKMIITVFDYTSKTPLENVNLKILHNSIEDIGLTNNSGIYEYETVCNDDYVTVLASKDGFHSSQRTFLKEMTGGSVNTSKQKTDVIEKKWKIGSDKGEYDIKDIYIYLINFNELNKDSQDKTEGKSILAILYSNLFEENFEFLPLVADDTKKLVDIKIHDSQNSKGILAIEIQKKEFQFEIENEKEEYPEIIRLIFKIKNRKLLKYYNVDSNATINGLQKYSCEMCIYCPNGHVFFLNSPKFSREDEFNFWDLGFLDVRSSLVYETGLLVKNAFAKNLFFSEWLHFLQIVIDKKIYVNLFEYLHFNKGFLNKSDRILYEPAFIRALKSLSQEIESSLSIDFLIYLCDLMKNNYKMISFTIFKKKLTSNLKNFNNDIY